MAASDLTGQRFGRLVAIADVGRSSEGYVLWRCACDCGSFTEVRSASLTRGLTTSCKCRNRDTAIQREARRRSERPSWNAGLTYAIGDGSKVYRTKSGWAKAVLRVNGNACELCEWAEATCDTHHRVPKSQGGQNTVANGIVLCPNCHRKVHDEVMTLL